jgi:hypothetical protein
MKDLLFRLIPSAVISGKIRDEDGEPLPEILVSALRQSYLAASRTFPPKPTCKRTIGANIACSAFPQDVTL